MNFTFNNKTINFDLDKEKGVIAVRPAFKPPRKIKERYEIKGRNGNLTKDTGTYEDRVIKVPLTFIDYDLDNFKLFQLEGESGILYFPNYFKDTYFLVYDIEIEELEDNYGVGEVSVTFYAESFRVTDYRDVTINSTTKLKVNGNVDTKPVLEIFAAGDVSFSINNETINIRNVEGSIILDFEKQEFYKRNSDGTLMNQGSKVVSLNMKKIRFIPGINFISDLTSNIKSIKMKYRENYL